MGYIFRINKTKGASKTAIVEWSNSTNTTYTHGFVDKIPDTTTTQHEITSIPSPFARIELVKEAFGKIVPEPLSTMSVDEVKEKLHGNSIYHKMVSDSLDIGQIFFSYEAMKDKIEILIWEKDKCIDSLCNSNEDSHQIYGKTLKMFYDQDAKGNDPYNFGKMQNLYILRYKGEGRKPMHIIGATSPATLFFSTANDEHSISKELCFGTDYAFDKEYASLDERATDYIKYLFAFKFSDPQFNTLYPEVSKYLDAVYYVLNNNLKNSIDAIERSCKPQIPANPTFLDQNYEKLIINNDNTNTNYQIEINGRPIHCKRYNNLASEKSDFEINSPKQTKGNLPLVLPVVNGNMYKDLSYFGSKFGTSHQVPYYDSISLNSRKLPGINIQYPYLTISDFLEDKIIELPSDIIKSDFFDGNYTSNSDLKKGYFLPITKTYFDYFTVNGLKGKMPSGKNAIDIKQVAAGVEVTLRIPIQKGNEVEYKRIYTLDVKANQTNNTGAIVVAPEDFMIGVFPPIDFATEEDAHYRIALLADFELNKESSCSCFNNDGFFTPDYVVRNVDIVGDIRSKVYLVDNKRFEGVSISILTDQQGKEKRATGVIIPIFKKRAGSSSFKFAIDLGTSNTHIEYSEGDDQMPKPFEFDNDHPQMSLVCKPSDIIRNHLRGEFVPEAIGINAQCHFPMRTVLCADKNNAGVNEKGIGSYAAFGNSSPAFMYNKTEVGTKYNDFIPNLKWSKMNPENEERIRCYIESLFILIRNKVIQEGGSLSQTQIKWFYPISMSNNKRGLFEKVWNTAYQKYFNHTGEPIAITESIAPYSFFQKTMAGVTNIVTIDIGGETTDIVVADTNDVKCIASMRFAADAIFGNSLVAVQNGSLNGIIKQFKDEFITKLHGLNDLQRMLRNKTSNNFGNSSEVASFLFSLSENDQVIQGHMQEQIDFNRTLMLDSSQKIVFYIFYTAIMYHLANLMRAKGLSVPTNIAFSGNGSKVVSILSPSKESLEDLTTKIFGLIYEEDVKRINLIINSENPKEATCKGGLFLGKQSVSVDKAKTVLLGINNSTLVTNQKYSNANDLYPDIVREVKKFMDFITLRLPRIISLSNEFGIDNDSIELAVASFNKDLSTYIENGVNLKLDSKDVGLEDTIEETLFFYPIIGVINDLSEQIYINSIR